MNLNLPLILLLAGLHLSVGHWRWPKSWSRVPWQTIAGGVAIAYVFLDILPKLGEAQRILSDVAIAAEGVYLLGLLGLLLFYGSNSQQRVGLRFGIAIAAYALSNLLFSYLLSHTAKPLDCLLLFTAVGLHYWVKAHSLQEHYPRQYQQQGRWILAGALLLGWGLELISKRNLKRLDDAG